MYLEDLFVVPRFRRHGLGGNCSWHLAQIAEERGYGRIEWSVLDWNELAIGFYKSLGAAPMDEWTVYRLTATRYASSPTAASTSAAWPSTFTLSQRFATLPSAPMRNVVRTMPMNLRP